MNEVLCYTLTMKKSTKKISDDLSLSIKNSEDVVKFLRKIGVDKTLQECVYVILVNARLHIIGYTLVSIGTINNANVDMKDVFRLPIQMGSYGCILVHNHPSGDPTPSAEDKKVTKRFVTSGKILGVETFDHIIVANFGGYYSFRQNDEMYE